MAIRVGGQAFLSLRSVWQRWFLWVLLAVLVSALLVTVVWLAGRHEAEQVQAALDRDTADAAADLRAGLQRNVQSLHALQSPGLDPERWATESTALMRGHREWLRLEWRDRTLRTVAAADTPYRVRHFDDDSRRSAQSDVALACASARKTDGAAYSPSHYVALPDSGGIEVMELCLPTEGGDYLIATYTLRDVLIELVAPTLRRGQEVSLTEPDGTRLASVGTARRSGSRVFSTQQLIDLPGAALVLRVDGWRAAPDVFPNLLTGLVTAISIALVSVLVLLARDTRRRLRAENELADTLAFRKAMEDSVITGLRARDLQGRITYVNPAFCEMVGFSAEELIQAGTGEAPYWPTELAHEYQKRQTLRLAGGMPPREGFESVFMHKDGSRFPVLIFEAPLINAHGVQTGWMSAFIDVSEQRRVEELSRATQERLQASARLATVGEMASLLSHELTQPLAAIASYASGSLNLLQGAKGDGAEVAMAVRRIAEQADRAGQVIRSVHDFVRRRDRTREPVVPQALIDAVLPLVRLQARKLGVRIDLVLADALPTVLCDRTLVEQVLLNLARNAMQAMDMPELRERVLTLRVTRAGRIGAPDAPADMRQWLAFSVADIGSGISPDVAERLFTPFFTTRADGMGLGLSLCRTVVEQHGGVLMHEPHHPRGTIFRFTLPIA
ncbi:two-component system sensor histidine kinase NtrB [Variovorax arabinosiphilus]|uniref:two-component system sensor histidine kinase NtrB n=1 Tax=Variovorax arabinosiphilus TaxID=3053498 RepID=UPI002578A17E|nr:MULTISPECIES: ATP-binding protein [unclassified Variovorax]MDM0121824.1 PAS domain S-box protein [Variovorax sp. J2L1-78]MDM0131646.1 PAS domain S-box protein [Variovorax sp. J2L1-63]MDM0234587.1 PAS domain S-box protein [Variovorax sp. J2R1-6]